MLCQAAMAEAEGEAERSVSLLGVERERLISELGESTGQASALRDRLHCAACLNSNAANGCRKDEVKDMVHRWALRFEQRLHRQVQYLKIQTEYWRPFYPLQAGSTKYLFVTYYDCSMI